MSYANRGKRLFKKGLNKFSDLDPEEWRALFRLDEEREAFLNAINSHDWCRDVEIPEEGEVTFGFSFA